MSALLRLSPEQLEKAIHVWADLYPKLFYAVGEQITYPDADRKTDPKNPTSEELRDILFIFRAEGAIEITQEITYGKYQLPYQWTFKALQPGFNDLEKKLYDLHMQRLKPSGGVNFGEVKVALTLDDQKKYLKEEYDQLLKEVTSRNDDTNLETQYKTLIGEVKTQLTKNIQSEYQSPPTLGKHKLEFKEDDGVTLYRGVGYEFRGKKSRAFLTVLKNNKNTPYSLDDIKRACNPLISKSNLHFKKEKEVRDTLNYIRKKLKVKISEFFPIEKSDDNWIWLEK